MKYLLFIIGFLLAANLCSAFFIQNIAVDKNQYSDGELVTATVVANANGLELTADFSSLDTNYDPGMVLTQQTSNNTYKAYYPISFSNLKGDGAYTVVFSLYQRSTDTSTVASYQVRLNNANITNRTASSEKITLRVNHLGPSNQTIIKVQSGMIMVCNSRNCTTITESEYDAARNFIITSGKVTLSNLTYDTLKAEITAGINEQNKVLFQQYLDQIIQIKGDLDNSVNALNRLWKNQTDWQKNQTVMTQKIVNRNTYVTAGALLMVMVLVVLSFFIFYLKTQTTWLD